MDTILHVSTLQFVTASLQTVVACIYCAAEYINSDS